MWTYHQASGSLTRLDQQIATGYSGRDPYKNDPTAEARKGEGPIPRGRWKIKRKYDSKRVGPYALELEPVGHDAHGRSAFLIHGDKIGSPGTASNGCIILAKPVRQRIWTSGDRELEVVD